MSDWKQIFGDVRSGATKLAQATPAIVKAFTDLNRSTSQESSLDEKTRELIALAVAVTTRCDGCIAAHAQAAQKAGASKQEVADALGTAISLNAGAAFVYSTRVLEAFDQFGA
ncbi:carboxymuconolactone decarboxylase family protein [Caballeronia calidae]|uniref:carboxymuconolactone decarboxylase family protein n=1 Tax=Caballeronia calidae TaxID=1777139 RepID=UPI0009EEC851|nr:carboxymuconolactone decarboxylase family protein [Caballeronia calidae]